MEIIRRENKTPVSSQHNKTLIVNNNNLHLHMHKHSSTKQSNRLMGTTPRQCLICNSFKRMKRGERFCSPGCSFKYHQHKKKVYLKKKEEWEKANKRKWYQVWKD